MFIFHSHYHFAAKRPTSQDFLLCFLAMSCLNLNLNLTKLLPARKAWKVFTNRVQSKIHKLNRSKTIKKPKSRFNKPTKRTSSWPTDRFKHKPKPTSRKLGYHHTHHFQRRASAVYIDRLFIEPVSVVKEHVQPSIIKASVVSKVYKETSSSNSKEDELGDYQQEDMATMSQEDSADVMWESLVLASPQMNGINERAEEFISSFRAELRLQETLARSL